jgi:hypothetical protein
LFAQWIGLPSRLERAARVSRENRGSARRTSVPSTHEALLIAMSDEDQTKPALRPKVMVAFGRELRRMYAEIIAEGVPERFAEILRRLDGPTSERETR